MTRTQYALAGAYLKLWESKDLQREYIQQHMTQGQVYSHWGKVDDEVHLDSSQVEGLLARRTVYHADMSRSAQQKREGSTSVAAYVKRDSTGTEARCEGASDTVAVPGDVTTCAQTSGPPEGRARVKAASGVGACPQTQAEKRRNSGVELQGAGMSQQEKSAAAREHNKRVLAKAGLEALGVQGALDGDGMEARGANKRHKAGGAVKKLEKMMRKKL